MAYKTRRGPTRESVFRDMLIFPVWITLVSRFALSVSAISPDGPGRSPARRHSIGTDESLELVVPAKGGILREHGEALADETFEEPEAEELEDEEKEINGVGRTAFIVNDARAREKDAPEPLYYDNFSPLFQSKWLARAKERITRWGNGQRAQKKEELSTEDTAFPVWLAMGSRTAYIDARLRRTIQQGAKQVVILGSGLDTRALRLFEPGVRFFEVDQAPVVDFKVAQLAKQGFKNLPSTMIRGNYLDEIDLFAELQKAGVDPTEKILFLWEGNSMYLPLERSVPLVRDLLKRYPKGTLLFDQKIYPFANATGPTKTGSEKCDKWMKDFHDIATEDGHWLWIGDFDLESLQEQLCCEILELATLEEVMRETRGDQYMDKQFNDHSKWVDEFKFHEILGKKYRIATIRGRGEGKCD